MAARWSWARTGSFRRASCRSPPRWIAARSSDARLRQLSRSSGADSRARDPQQNGACAGCTVALLALYEGQVELLRRLVEQSEILRGRQFPLEIGLPSRLHQRECDFVLLSLTRSHGHRSVAFGEDARELPLALTRPRRRLLVFGDPGTLCKRTSWHGPLEHLDAHSAQQELVRLSCFLACLRQQGHSIPTLNGLASVRV